jgi:hypothetical protein
MPVLSWAQFFDEFSDGNISANPTWQGDVADFQVNVNLQLQLSAPSGTTDTSVIYTDFVSNFSDTVTWRLKWRLNFSPSDNNNGRVYLMSSGSNFNTAQGYYVRWGENGAADVLKLYRFNGTTSTLIVTGTTVYSTSSQIALNVVRWPNGNWVLESDPNAGENFVSEGSAIDNTYAASTHFGLWCKYTTSNVANFYFDDVQVDSLISDIEPPTLLSAEATAANIVQLIFSESLDPVSANTAANYIINSGIGQAVSAFLNATNDSIVTLTFGNNFTLAQQYIITVSGVKDLAGNTITTTNQSFYYFLFDTPAYRDIVINEIMADPTPVIGLPEAEFIELYNRGTGAYSLSGATISDASSTATIPTNINHYLLSGEYVVICDIADTALFSAYPKVIGVPSLPAFNNGGDDVILTVGTEIIDAVSYSSAWYQDAVKADGGYTLELINPETPCSGSGNWIASNNPDGGTPGAQNSVYNTDPDVIAPSVKSVSVLSQNELEISFSEPVNSTTVLTINISIDNGLTIDSSIVASNFASSANVYFTPEIDSAQIYTITISDISDCVGNVMTQSAVLFGFGALPEPFDIVINELYPAPDVESLLPQVEFVEIYNRSDKLLRLEGVTISDASTSAGIDAIVLFPKSYAVICDDNNSFLFADSVKIAEVGTLPSLNNTDDVITLSLNGTVIDQVTYTDDWYGEIDPCCTTLERKNPNDLCRETDAWFPSTNTIGGTPGFENSVFSTDETIFELLSASVVSLNEVELHFSGKTDSASLVNASVSIGNSNLSFASSNPSFSTGVFASNTDFERGKVYEIQVGGIEDCAGFATNTFSTEVYLHQSGDVILNEVLFDPTTTGSDFVELKNTTVFDISLNGWSFGYYNPEDSLIYLPFESTANVITSAQHLALTEAPSKVINDYPNAVAENVVLNDLPSLSNDAGSVMIFDQFNELMDQFDYTADMHFALLDNVDGVSLERISSTEPTNEAYNWHSASSAVNFATPGYENSQHNEAFVAETMVSLTSEFVSPDNDGYQEVVGISYQLTDPGYSISIKVFNDKGYEIKTVTSNELIGASGIINWDGTNDLNEKADIGIHIVYVMLFNLRGTKQEFRLPVVVSSKL